MEEIHSSGLADHAHPTGTKTGSSRQAIKDLIYDVERVLYIIKIHNQVQYFTF